MTLSVVMMFIITTTLSIAASIYSIRRSGTVTPLMMFIGASHLFIYIGFLVYYFDSPGKDASFLAVTSVSLGILSVSVGGFIGTAASSRNRLRQNALDIDSGKLIPYQIAILVALIVFSVVIVYFYLVGYVPLFEGIKTLGTEGFVSGLVNDPRTNRDVYINPQARYIPFQGLMEAIRYMGLPVVAIWFIHFFRRGIRKRTSIIVVLVAAILTTLTGQRWPLMFLITTVIIYLSWSKTNWKQYARQLRKVALLAVIAGIILSFLLGRTDERVSSYAEMLLFGTRNLLERILYGNSLIPFESYAVYPINGEFLHGDSWIRNLECYLPGELASYPIIFYQKVTGNIIGYTAPPDFFTEAYINFGFIGVIFISFAWGILLALIQLPAKRARRTQLGMSFYVLIVMLLAFTTISGVVSIVTGVIVIVWIYMLITAFTFMKKATIRK